MRTTNKRTSIVAIGVSTGLLSMGTVAMAQGTPMSEGIATSVVKAPIVPDGDVAGAPADFVINFDTDLDPAIPGRTLLAGNTIRVTLPETFSSAGDGIVGAELVQADDGGGSIVVGDATVGTFSIDAPEGATGQAVSGGPSVEANAPVSGLPTGRLTAQFTAGDTAGRYVTTFEMDGGNSLSMYVDVAE